MSKIFLFCGVFAASFLVNRSNAAELAYFVMGLLAAIGLHSAAEHLVNVIPGPTEPFPVVFRIVPGIVFLCGMAGCVLLVHLNFAGDSHLAMEHAVSESLKTLAAFATIRFFR